MTEQQRQRLIYHLIMIIGAKKYTIESPRSYVQDVLNTPPEKLIDGSVRGYHGLGFSARARFYANSILQEAIRAVRREEKVAEANPEKPKRSRKKKEVSE